MKYIYVQGRPPLQYVSKKSETAKSHNRELIEPISVTDYNEFCLPLCTFVNGLNVYDEYIFISHQELLKAWLMIWLITLGLHSLKHKSTHATHLPQTP